jgi:glycosyltransferase involved in cell wall biosynthesis
MTQEKKTSLLPVTTSNVAIVVCAWPPLGGGIGNNAYYHAKELGQLDYDVSVFTPLAASASISKKSSQRDKFSLNYEKVWFKFGKAGFLFSLFGRLKDSDIIHLYHPFFGTDLIIGWFKKRHPEKKLILHYEMDPIGRGWQKIFFKLYFKLFFGWLVGLSDRIVVLSFDHGKNSYLKKHLNNDPSKYVEIPNGIRTDIFKPSEKNKQLRADLGIGVEDKVVIFVGGLDDQHFFKGVDVLLQAFKKLDFKNKKLLIVGDGNRRGDFEITADKLGIKNQVIFTGWIKNEELSEFYALADIFVLPSTESTESFGIVIAEAQATGLPAIVSNWPGSRQTIVDGQTGFLVEPRNVDDLKDKMEKMFSDDDLRIKMGKEATINSHKKYNWSEVIKKIDNLYKDLQNE